MLPLFSIMTLCHKQELKDKDIYTLTQQSLYHILVGVKMIFLNFRTNLKKKAFNSIDTGTNIFLLHYDL